VVEWEDTTVTVKVPFTETRTVRVPTTRWAMVDSFGGGSVSAARPTPSRAAQADTKVESRSANADADKREPRESQGDFKLQNYQQPKAPAAQPGDLDASTQPTPAADASLTAARPVPSAVRVAGWRPTRRVTTEPVEGPAIAVAAK
jgi:hypothetical protein